MRGSRGPDPHKIVLRGSAIVYIEPIRNRKLGNRKLLIVLPPDVFFLGLKIHQSRFRLGSGSPDLQPVVDPTERPTCGAKVTHKTLAGLRGDSGEGNGWCSGGMMTGRMEGEEFSRERAEERKGGGGKRCG